MQIPDNAYMPRSARRAETPARVFRGRLSRRNRSKYQPHQGVRECARRAKARGRFLFAPSTFRLSFLGSNLTEVAR
jgi:hypothetical protein